MSAVTAEVIGITPLAHPPVVEDILAGVDVNGGNNGEVEAGGHDNADGSAKPKVDADMGTAVDGTGDEQPNGAAPSCDNHDIAGQDVKDEPEKDPKMEAFEKEFEDVKASSDDFDKWCQLLSAAEKLGNIEKLREVYDAFLGIYPLCYGYWKKYADMESKHGSPENAKLVYEKGLSAISNSIDLWLAYCNFLQGSNASPADIRSAFGRGIAVVGEDYLSHPLWDAYLKFENGLGSTHEVVAVLRKIIQDCPLKELDKYMASLKQFAAEHTAEELMSPEELNKIRGALQDAKQAAEAAKQAAIAAALQDSPNGAEGAPPPAGPGTVDASDQDAAAPMDIDAPDSSEPAKSVVPVVSESEVKSAWLSAFDSALQANKAALERIAPFEVAIKRPYFHVKPLDQAQLTNWWAYLDNKIKSGSSHAAIVRLFERCLVPCAAYSVFWERYIRYLEGSDGLESASLALSRAQHIHCKRRPEIFLFAAQFFEAAGNADGARQALSEILERLAPGSIEATVAKANFERRQGDVSAASQAYEALIEGLTAASPIPEEQFTYAVLKYASLRQATQHDSQAALDIIRSGLRQFPYSRVLWESAMHLAERSGQNAVRNVQALRAEAEAALTGSEVPKDHVISAQELATKLSERAFDFLDETTSIDEVRKAAAACANLTATAALQAADKKRKAADATSVSANKSAKVSDSQKATTVSVTATPAASTTGPGTSAVAAAPVSAGMPSAAPTGPAAYYSGQAYAGYHGYNQQYPMYPATYQYGQAYPPY